MLGKAPPTDEACGEFDEAFVHEQVAVPADCEAFELVEVGDGLFDHPANRAESDDLLASALRNDQLDPFGAQPLAEGGGAVAAVGQDGIGSAARASNPPGDEPNRFDQDLSGLDVGDVPCGGDDRERQARTVAGDVVLGTGPAPVYRLALSVSVGSGSLSVKRAPGVTSGVAVEPDEDGVAGKVREVRLAALPYGGLRRVVRARARIAGGVDGVDAALQPPTVQREHVRVRRV